MGESIGSSLGGYASSSNTLAQPPSLCPLDAPLVDPLVVPLVPPLVSPSKPLLGKPPTGIDVMQPPSLSKASESEDVGRLAVRYSMGFAPRGRGQRSASLPPDESRAFRDE